MPLDDAPARTESEFAVGPDDPNHGGVPAGLLLASAVMFVSELERSAAFYAELLGWTITIQETDVALLACPDGFQLYLRRRGPRAPRIAGHIGVQYLIWTAPHEQDLDRCERILRTQSAQVTRSTLDGFTLLEGHGPDNAPILIAYPGPQDVPRHHVMSRIYRW